MDLQKLYYFVSVAEERNFTEAAKKNFISQPSLSRHINEFESELHLRLFNRTKHAAVLTEEGKALLPFARDIVKKCQYFSNYANSLTESGTGIITVGYSGYWEYQYLCDLIREFSARYPNVNFFFVREHHGKLNQKLRFGECDIILTIKDEYPTFDSRIGWITVASAPLMAVFPDTHPLAARKSISLKELENEPLILLSHDEDSILNEIIVHTFKKQNILPKYSQLRPQNSYDLALLVLANKGIALVTKLMQLSDIDGLSFCSIEDDIPKTEFVIAYQNPNHMPLISAFLETAKQTPFYRCE